MYIMDEAGQVIREHAEGDHSGDQGIREGG